MKEKLRLRKRTSPRPHSRSVERRGPSLPSARPPSLPALLPLPPSSPPPPLSCSERRVLLLPETQPPRAPPARLWPPTRSVGVPLSAGAGPQHPPCPSPAAQSPGAEHSGQAPWNNLHRAPDPRTRMVCVDGGRGEPSWPGITCAKQTCRSVLPSGRRGKADADGTRNPALGPPCSEAGDGGPTTAPQDAAQESGVRLKAMPRPHPPERGQLWEGGRLTP